MPGENSNDKKDEKRVPSTLWFFDGARGRPPTVDAWRARRKPEREERVSVMEALAFRLLVPKQESKDRERKR